MLRTRQHQEGLHQFTHFFTRAGNPLNLGARVGGYILSDTEVANHFASRDKVFAGYGNGAGWNPQP